MQNPDRAAIALVNKRQRFADGIPGPPMKIRHAAQIIVVGVQALGRLSLGPFDLGALELRRYRAHHALGHLVLQFENVVERAFEAICPEMCSRGGIDQLPGDPHAGGGLAHAALEHVADAQFAADLFHIDRAALVGEARIARDDEQPADARQRRDDVLDHAVGEVLLLRVAAQIQKWQNRDRRFVRQL